jgi:protein-S-isoprenylcysteine O-methyltransferase Ste14
MPPVYLLAAILAMLGLHRWFPIRRLVPGTWRWLGLAPAAIGLALALSAVRIFVKRKTTFRPGDTSTSLVTEGPFRFTRNPMYLGMALLLTGLAIGLGSLSPWLLLPLFIATISINIIPAEEAMLSEAFGPQYSDYQSRVRRWV